MLGVFTEIHGSMENSRLVLRLYSMSAEKIESTSIKHHVFSKYMVFYA